MKEFFQSVMGSLSRFFPAKPTPVAVGGLRYSSLMAIFQFLNTNIYDIEENIPITEEDIEGFAFFCKEVQSPAAHHLSTSDGRTKVTSRSHYLREDGAFMTFVEYTYTAIEVGDEHYATMLLSTLDMVDGTPEFTPHFTMTGTYSLRQDGGTDFVPVDVKCLIRQDGEDLYFIPTTIPEFQATLAYANSAFIQLLSDSMIAADANQAWVLDTSRYEEAATLCSVIRGRNAFSFADDIEKLKRVDAAIVGGQPTPV